MGRGGDAAAIMAERSKVTTWLMSHYFRYYAWRRLHAVRLARGTLPAVDRSSGVIVYANHPSWWDPVMFVLLQRYAFPDRAGYGPMDAEALGRYGILKRIGVFCLNPETRGGAARFLRTGLGILQTPGTVLWVTAEGGFTDPRRRPVRLRRGVAHLMRSHPNIVAIPLAMEFTFWNESTPEALLRFGAPLRSDATCAVPVWDALLADSLTETMDCLAVDAISRDPARFENVLAGRAGIGGMYDLWRRAKAVVRGERPRLEHEKPRL
jgi:1-acyl-sn-glycerol-3-phosphate acyltransferase